MADSIQLMTDGKSREALILPPRLAGEIVEHARQGFPEEVCGLVAGQDGVAVAVCPGRNISPTPRIAYELDHETLARIIEMEDAGLEPIGIYHSHPRGPETPSPADTARATYPDSIYLIVSLADLNHPVLRGFQLAEGAASEVEVTGFSLT